MENNLAILSVVDYTYDELCMLDGVLPSCWWSDINKSSFNLSICCRVGYELIAAFFIPFEDIPISFVREYPYMNEDDGTRSINKILKWRLRIGK